MTRAMLAVLLLYSVPASGQLTALLGDDFFGRKGNLVSVLVTPVDSFAATVTRDVLLLNDRGDTVHARIRAPRTTSARHPVVMMVVGIETGRDVVAMIAGYDSVLVFGIDYPFKGPLDFSGWNAFGTSFELREAAYRTVAHLLLSVDWLSGLPYVDTTDITLAAVSFGVFTGIPAAVIDERIDRLVVIQGGGILYDVVKMNAERLGLRVPTWLAGWWAETFFEAFEPTAYVGRLSPRPFLLVSAARDQFFPETSVAALYHAAAEPKEWLHHSSGHVAPHQQELILELTTIVAQRLYGKP